MAVLKRMSFHGFAFVCVSCTLIVLVFSCSSSPQSQSQSQSNEVVAQDLEALRDELLQMADAEQVLRRKVFIDGVRDEETLLSVVELDHQNTERMKEIVAAIGWPTISKVGEEASKAAWLLVQHADRDVAFQEYCLMLMKVAAFTGDVSPGDLRYLTDRVQINKGLPQVYGTQAVPPPSR